MRRLTLVMATVSLLAAIGAAQPFRDPIFLVGGDSTSPATNRPPGLYLMDATKQTTTPFFPPTVTHCELRSVTMDVDNRSIIFVGRQMAYCPVTKYMNDICRFDPSRRAITTIATGNSGGPVPNYVVENTIVDQNGDYVFTAAEILRTYPVTLRDYHVLRCRPGAGITTLFTASTHIGESNPLSGAIGRNISSGNLLIQSLYRSTLHNWHYGVIEVDIHQQGKWTTFSTGGGQNGYGWNQPWGHIRQDYANDALITERYGHVWRLPPGTTPYTTLITYNFPYGWMFSPDSCGVLDLQSSTARRIMAPMSCRVGTASTAALVGIDLATHAVTTISCDPKNAVGYPNSPTDGANVFEPYRARHIASVQTGAGNKWAMHFSVPNHPGKAYVAAVSVTGFRPPIKLPDGRRIWLYPDPITVATASARLRPVFDPGPLLLDAKGEARGSLDLSKLPKLGGVPLWIALVILDPKAPGGIAFIPDTYVIRVP